MTKVKDEIRPLFDLLMDKAEEEGLDLTVDRMYREVYYPDFPTIRFTIEIGGLFNSELEFKEEELQ